MNANTRKPNAAIRLGATAIAVALTTLLPVKAATAAPVQGAFTNDPTHCDNVADVKLTHELGDVSVFPVDEQLSFTVTPINTTVCVPDDGISNDWSIRIINVGTQSWEDVFFVADEGYYFANGNYDGYISDLTMPFNKEAFRIDAAGTNNNLQSESMTVDGILEPGEVWDFWVSNFAGPNDVPTFDSVGKFALSSASGPPSNASILANPVPEPATIGILAVSGLAMLHRRKTARRA